MVPIEPWRNSTPFFGAVAFCTTKIDDFRTSLTTLATNSSNKKIRKTLGEKTWWYYRNWWWADWCQHRLSRKLDIQEITRFQTSKPCCCSWEAKGNQPLVSWSKEATVLFHLHLPVTFQTPSRQLLETNKTPSRHHKHTLLIPKPWIKAIFTNFKLGGVVGGWVDYTPRIEPLRGPTCMLKTSKISTQVEIASWARVWQYIVKHSHSYSYIAKNIHK